MKNQFFSYHSKSSAFLIKGVIVSAFAVVLFIIFSALYVFKNYETERINSFHGNKEVPNMNVRALQYFVARQRGKVPPPVNVPTPSPSPSDIKGNNVSSVL